MVRCCGHHIDSEFDLVSDTAEQCVLGWRDALTFQNGARADLILGQLDDQSTERQGPSVTGGRSLGFSLPGPLAIDSKGSLYIVDTGNNRILRFAKPFANCQPRKHASGPSDWSTATTNPPHKYGGITGNRYCHHVGWHRRTLGASVRSAGKSVVLRSL